MTILPPREPKPPNMPGSWPFIQGYFDPTSREHALFFGKTGLEVTNLNRSGLTKNLVPGVGITYEHGVKIQHMSLFMLLRILGYERAQERGLEVKYFGKAKPEKPRAKKEALCCWSLLGAKAHDEPPFYRLDATSLSVISQGTTQLDTTKIHKALCLAGVLHHNRYEEWLLSEA